VADAGKTLSPCGAFLHQTHYRRGGHVVMADSKRRTRGGSGLPDRVGGRGTGTEPGAVTVNWRRRAVNATFGGARGGRFGNKGARRRTRTTSTKPLKRTAAHPAGLVRHSPALGSQNKRGSARRAARGNRTGPRISFAIWMDVRRPQTSMGNGVTDALTDGLLNHRYMFGGGGPWWDPSVTQKTRFGPNATRTTPTAVQTRLWIR